MTRNKAFKKINRELNKYTMTVKFRDVERLINKIFDDFESRTCEDCKYSNMNDGYLLACKLHREAIRTFACCNKFERREDV